MIIIYWYITIIVIVIIMLLPCFHDAFSRQALACIYTCSPEAMSEVMSEATSEAMSEAAPLKRKGQRVHAMQSVIGISRESHLSQLPCAWYY